MRLEITRPPFPAVPFLSSSGYVQLLPETYHITDYGKPLSLFRYLFVYYNLPATLIKVRFLREQSKRHNPDDKKTNLEINRHFRRNMVHGKSIGKPSRWQQITATYQSTTSQCWRAYRRVWSRKEKFTCNRHTRMTWSPWPDFASTTFSCYYYYFIVFIFFTLIAAVFLP